MILAESDNLQDYLASDGVVDWRSPDVYRTAWRLVDGIAAEADRARRLYEWVRDEIPHSRDIDADIVTCSASQVLRARTGICFAKSHLLAALLRAVGIPAGFCYQLLRHDPPLSGMVLHGLNGLYLADPGRWIRVDARGNVGGIDAQFGLDREQLAFPPNPAAGERTYDTVSHRPAAVVVAALRRYRSRRALWPHLPAGLGAGGGIQEESL